VPVPKRHLSKSSPKKLPIPLPQTKVAWLLAVRVNPELIDQIPASMRSQWASMHAVVADGRLLAKVPASAMNESIIREAMRGSPPPTKKVVAQARWRLEMFRRVCAFVAEKK
jgi:hypothetical protein